MNVRQEVLDEAMKIVTKDREKQYGSPEDSFKKIADLWGAYLGIDLKPSDAGIMMCLLKIARMSYKHKLDNYIDLAGYASCTAECSENENTDIQGGIQGEFEFNNN